MWYFKLLGRTFYFRSPATGIITVISCAFLIVAVAIVLFCSMISGLHSLGGWWLVIAGFLLTGSFHTSINGYKQTYAIFKNVWLRKFLGVCFIALGFVSFIYHF